MERHIWTSHPYVAYTMVDKLYNPFTLLVGPCLVSYLLYKSTKPVTEGGYHLPWWNILASYGVWLTATRTAKLLPHLWHQPEHIIYVPAFIAFGYYFAIMKLYALVTLHEVSPRYVFAIARFLTCFADWLGHARWYRRHRRGDRGCGRQARGHYLRPPPLAYTHGLCATYLWRRRLLTASTPGAVTLADTLRRPFGTDGSPGQCIAHLNCITYASTSRFRATTLPNCTPHPHLYPHCLSCMIPQDL